MTTNLFTFIDNDLSVGAIWDPEGTPGFVPDPWNAPDTTAMQSNDGMSDQVMLNAGAVLLDGTSDATVVLYVRTTVLPGSAEIIVTQGFEVLGYPLLFQRLGSTGDLRVQALQDSGGSVISDIDGDLITGQGRVQIGATIEGDPDGDAIIRIFINGVEVESYINFSLKLTTGFKTFEGNQQFRLGRFPGATMEGEWTRPRAASGLAFNANQMFVQFLEEEALLPRIFDIGDERKGMGPDKNILPFMSHNLPLVSGNDESSVFSIKGFRKLGLLIPAVLTGVTGIQVHVSNKEDGTFAPVDIVDITPGGAEAKVVEVDLVLAWSFAKIVLIGSGLSITAEIPMVLT